MRNTTLGSYSLLALVAFACSGSNDDPSESTGTGGATTTVGQGGSAVGGSTGSNAGSATGGTSLIAGTTTASLGGSSGSLGGATQEATGGSSTATGGATTATGGTTAKGGTTSTGGTTAKGGTTSTGGTTAKGGTTSTGGTTAKGGTTSTGGTTAKGGTTSTGGATTCDWSAPPSNVSAWVNESWNAQLGTNIKGRQAWLIDNAMKGKGQINLCMRWGASKAPTATQKAGMANAVQKWFNLWFSQLNGYGCFPYPNLTVKVTGWAVKPGNTSWLSDVDTSTAKIYTEVDGSGEPKCPDSCSFFSNWSHSFPSCPGGEAFHHDYWFWIDDTNAAAAEGGDWGLRMPVASLDNAMANVAYDVNTVIHEMGHGFGFQDYYDWTGSTPAGGSLMIVGPNTTSPTVGDTWLIRRTWKEMKTLRGW